MKALYGTEESFSRFLGVLDRAKKDLTILSPNFRALFGMPVITDDSLPPDRVELREGDLVVKVYMFKGDSVYVFNNPNPEGLL